MSLFDQSCDSIPAWPFPRGFSTRELFRAQSWIFASAPLPHYPSVEMVLRSRYVPRSESPYSCLRHRFESLFSGFVLSAPDAVEFYINIIVHFHFGPAELRCYHRAVAKLTPEFPGTGTSQFRPRCHSCTPHFSLRSALHALPRPSLRLSYPSHFRRFKAHTSLAT